MRSLFLKIFLSFWLVALLLGSAQFLASRYFFTPDLELAGQRLEGYAETLGAVFAERSPTNMRRWMEEFSRRSGRAIRPLIIDADGRDARGRQVPPPLAERIRNGQRDGSAELHPGLFAVLRPIPGTPLTLAALIPVQPGHDLPVAARVALAVVVSGLVCLGLAALLTRPLRDLRRATRALAAGDLSARVHARGHDEIANLGHDFDRMADHLQALLEGQRRLLRDVSHELRSPLARLKVALELARAKGDTATALTRIEREADRLEGLLAEVLSLARLESGRAELKREPVALAPLLEGIVRDAAFEAEAAGRQVVLEAETTPSVNGDPALLRSAVENVVRNAVRYTAPESQVSVALAKTGEQAEVRVRDHGPGVPDSELERLFEPFTRVSAARERGSGGYGLGLAISRRAVTAHGGNITARNHPDGGLEVTIRLPLAGRTA